MRTRVLAGAVFAVFVAVSTWGFAQSPNNPSRPSSPRPTSGNSIPRPQSGIPRPKTTIPQPTYTQPTYTQPTYTQPTYTQPTYTHTPPPRTRSLLEDYKPSTAHLKPKSKEPKGESSHISRSSIKGLFILIGGVVGVIGWFCRKVMG